jgi:two-component system OmpR family sensor kinase
MKKAQSRFALLTIVLTTILSLGIGGFATLQSRSSDLSTIDSQLSLIERNVTSHLDEAISAALLIIEEERLDVTLSLVTNDGLETVINESNLIYTQGPSETLIKSAVANPVSVEGVERYRLQAVSLPGGDFLLLARSLTEVDSRLQKNLVTLALFTLGADSIAIFLSIFFLSRHNRRLDEKALERMKSFLGDASHELRTPLTVIKGYTEMLSKNQFSEEADRVRAFNRVGDEIVRMESLIHDLLLLAELGESKPVAFAEIDLAEIIRAHATDFATLNPDRSVTIDIPDHCICRGEREHLNRLIQNALTNIDRHTPHGAPVRISLKASQKSAIMVIEDGGPGLPGEAYKSEIKAMNRFDPSRSRESGGSGLGLSIIAAIVQEHRGKLTLRKSSLGGLAIEVEIPR